MSDVLFEKRGFVGILTLNRPHAFNALNTAMLGELYDTACMIQNNGNIRVVVITGAGKAFAAGADITEMANLYGEGALEFARAGHRAFDKIDDLSMPVIAAINGFALGGGCELALCCDIRLAGDKARLGQPEVGLGITPGFGGTQRLPRVVGVASAMKLVLTGQQIDAQEAKRIRLVNEVYPQETLMDEALKMAETIAANAPVAVRYCKSAMSRRIERFLESDLEYEAKLFSDCFNTADQKAAMQAFIEKRPHDEFKGA